MFHSILVRMNHVSENCPFHIYLQNNKRLQEGNHVTFYTHHLKGTNNLWGCCVTKVSSILINFSSKFPQGLNWQEQGKVGSARKILQEKFKISTALTCYECVIQTVKYLQRDTQVWHSPEAPCCRKGGGQRRDPTSY